MRKRPVLLCTAALLSLALTGCSGGDDAESASDSSTSSARDHVEPLSHQLDDSLRRGLRGSHRPG